MKIDKETGLIVIQKHMLDFDLELDLKIIAKYGIGNLGTDVM